MAEHTSIDFQGLVIQNGIMKSRGTLLLVVGGGPQELKYLFERSTMPLSDFFEFRVLFVLKKLKVCCECFLPDLCSLLPNGTRSLFSICEFWPSWASGDGGFIGIPLRPSGEISL